MILKPRSAHRRSRKRDVVFIIFVASLCLVGFYFFIALSSSKSSTQNTPSLPKKMCSGAGFKAVFVTSITRPFRDHAVSREWKHTLWEDQHPQFPLWVYTENTWEVAHGRAPLTAKDFPFSDWYVGIYLSL
jgi:hypothetical protein